MVMSAESEQNNTAQELAMGVHGALVEMIDQAHDLQWMVGVIEQAHVNNCRLRAKLKRCQEVCEEYIKARDTFNATATLDAVRKLDGLIGECFTGDTCSN